MTEPEQDQEQQEPKELGPEPVDITGKEPVLVAKATVVDEVLQEAAKSTDEDRILRALSLVVKPWFLPELAKPYGKKRRFVVHNLDEDYREHLRIDFGDDDDAHEWPTMPSIEEQIETRFHDAVEHVVGATPAQTQAARLLRERGKANRAVEQIADADIGPRMAELLGE